MVIQFGFFNWNFLQHVPKFHWWSFLKSITNQVEYVSHVCDGYDMNVVLQIVPFSKRACPKWNVSMLTDLCTMYSETWTRILKYSRCGYKAKFQHIFSISFECNTCAVSFHVVNSEKSHSIKTIAFCAYPYAVLFGFIFKVDIQNIK